MKLDIGCGQNKREGFTGIDIGGDADITHDLLTFPWPIESDTVEEVHCSHFFEHVPGPIRPKFMDELYRVMKTGAKATFITPAYNSSRAVQDFTHAWPPVCPDSYYYFNRAWREGNRLTHGAYEMACDFDFQVTGSINPTWSLKTYEAQVFASTHYNNVTIDIQAILTKR